MALISQAQRVMVREGKQRRFYLGEEGDLSFFSCVLSTFSFFSSVRLDFISRGALLLNGIQREGFYIVYPDTNFKKIKEQ